MLPQNQCKAWEDAVQALSRTWAPRKVNLARVKAKLAAKQK